MKSRFIFILLVMVAFGCNQSSTESKKVTKDAEVESYRMPSATEVFHLRGECAKLGEVIARENIIGRNLTQDAVSHYDPKTNRCYANLTVQSADLSGNYYGTYLYDAQTKEMLAFFSKKNGNVTGSIFYPVSPMGPYNKDTIQGDVQFYISSKMEDRDYSKK